VFGFAKANKQDIAFHPQTVLRDWGNDQAFRISDAVTGVCVFGATGSGKTSGPAKHLAYGYLAEGFGGLVLCAKKEERIQWQRWAEETGRTEDLVIVDSNSQARFNFLEWEAERPGEGGGFTINIVALLDEIASTVFANPGKGGDGDKFWKDALHHLNMNLVELPLLAGLRVSLPLLRSLVTSAPQTPGQQNDPAWQEESVCYQTIQEADRLTGRQGVDPEIRAAFNECKTYWLQEIPNLAEKTRSIILLSFSMLAHSFLVRPLRKLFCNDTTVKPEDTFAGKIIIVDLPIQEYRLAGRIANLTWKYCFQVGVLRRMQPQDRKHCLRPVFLWADEAQNFVSKFDAEYQATARSAGGCTVYLTQNRESYRRVLGNDDAVDSLLGNLQNKFFCQNAGDTNEWASRLLGEHWIYTNATNVGQGRNDNNTLLGQNNNSSGVTRSEQKRFYLEPSAFTTLKRGGELHDFLVESIVYKGGHLFPGNGKSGPLPYHHLTFDQR
jgi:hypothetical protein